VATSDEVKFSVRDLESSDLDRVDRTEGWGPIKGSLIRRWRMKSLRLRSQLGAEVAAESSAARYLVIFLVYSYSEVLVVF
jgi:hypothetical protein